MQTTSVLFVGNSYTSRNRLTQVLRTLLARGEPPIDATIEMITAGGKRLADHRLDAGPLAAALERRWDWVVLQEQSQIPGFGPDDPDWLESREAARALAERAAGAGAKVMLFMTWGHRRGDRMNRALYPDYSTMQARLTLGYRDFAAHASGPQRPVVVAPVGLAFQHVHDEVMASRDERAFDALYAADGSHPSVSGTCLAAYVLFASLTGRSPIRAGVVPAGVDAARLQRAAAAAVAGWSAVT